MVGRAATPHADYPWENPPVRLVVPTANPVAADEGATPEDVEFVPFGATNLRLTCFPLAESR